MLHIRRAFFSRSEDMISMEHIWSSSVKIDELAGETLCSGGIVGIWVEQIVPHRLDVIRIWAIFWDGAPSPSST